MKKILASFLLVFLVSILPLNIVHAAESDEYTEVFRGRLQLDYPLKKGDKLKIKAYVTYGVMPIKISSYETSNDVIFLTFDFPKGVLTTLEQEVPKDVSNFYLQAWEDGYNSARVYEVSVNDKLIFKGKTHLYNLANVGNLSYVATHDAVSFSWDNPTDENFDGVKVYRNGSLINTLSKEFDVFTDNGVFENTAYTYKFTSIYKDGAESSGVTQNVTTQIKPLDPSKIPPSTVTALTAVPTANSVKLTWKNPSDDDLAGIYVLRDGNVIADLPVTDKYEAIKLNPSTNYQFAVKAYDLDGNESPSAIVNATTLEGVDSIPPLQVKGVTATGGNNALYIKWDKNIESDLLGYDLYIDGKKVNSSIIKNNFYNVGDLVNDQAYTVMVVALDSSGNESPPSSIITGKPVSSGLPIFKTDYDLSDVANGVSEWFSSYWLIIAFASAIPLSFYVAARLKILFLER